MRSTKLSKKLLLSKETISNLESLQMDEIKGGYIPSVVNCLTIEPQCASEIPIYC